MFLADVSETKVPEAKSEVLRSDQKPPEPGIASLPKATVQQAAEPTDKGESQGHGHNCGFSSFRLKQLWLPMKIQTDCIMFYKIMSAFVSLMNTFEDRAC